MNIAMFTNTYLPLVGGASISIQRFSEELRRRGERVLIIAPTYEDEKYDEEGVLRVPALKNFGDSRFSMPLPLRLDLTASLEEFEPDIIHAHHPFCLGDTALRQAASLNKPIAVTHHTHLEQYVENVPAGMPWMANYIEELSVKHANLCDAVIAPTDSVKRELLDSGVGSPVHVLPTGVFLERFQNGDGPAFRERYGLPGDALLFGHVGRLAPEKNLEFLSRAMGIALRKEESARFAVVGGGDTREAMESLLKEADVFDRCVFTGVLKDQNLVDAYRAMDAFVFASKSETQGMVMVEAMACGTPVAALDARGACDIVDDGRTGALVAEEDEEAFAAAALKVAGQAEEMKQRAEQAAQRYSMKRCADELLRIYQDLVAQGAKSREVEASDWGKAGRAIEMEWEIWSNRLASLKDALRVKNKEGDTGPASQET